MRLLKSFCLIVLLSSAVFAQSKVMDKIKGFFPTVTESAGLANAVNVYMKISDWVRATSAVVRNMRGAVNDVRRAKSAVEDIISTAQAMKNFDLYNMDSWALTVDNAKLIVGLHTGSVLRSLGNFDQHAVGGVLDFMGSAGKIRDFDIRDEKNARRRLISREFSPSDDEAFIDGFFEEMQGENGRERRIELLRQAIRELSLEKAIVEAKAKDAPTPETKRVLYDAVRQIDVRINRIEKKILIQDGIRDGIIFAMRSDTIISDAKELMSLNLIEVERIHAMTRTINEHAAGIMNDIYRLAQNKISTPQKDTFDDPGAQNLSADNFSRITDGRGNSIFGDHPNQAPTPSQRNEAQAYRFGEMDKAEVNTQDIIQTRNQINLILLRQETILRNIDAMKANTLAYLLIIDGHKRSASLARYDAMRVHARRYQEHFPR